MAACFGDLVQDREWLLEVVQQDLTGKDGDEQVVGNGQKRRELVEKDRKLSDELRELSGLETVASLLLEFRANMEYLELENCYYSLKNLRKKLRESDILVKQNLQLQQSLVTYVDSLHVQLVEKISGIWTTQFWIMGDKSVKFTSKALVSPGNVEFEYQEFFSWVVNEFFPNNTLDSNNWFIKEIVIGELQEVVRGRLSTLVREFVMFESLLNNVKSALFTSSSNFEYSSESHCLTWSLDDSSSTISYTEKTLIQKIDSFQSLIKFFLKEVPKQNINPILLKIGPCIATEVANLVRHNASIILHQHNSNVKDAILSVNENLKELSNKTEGHWSYLDDDLKKLLSDTKIRNSYLIDRIFESQLSKLRGIYVKNPDFSKDLIEVDLISDSHTIHDEQLNKTQLKSPKKSSAKTGSTSATENTDWDWNGDEEDSAWDNEVEIDLETEEKKKNTDEENDWDDNGWDIDFDDEEIEKVAKSAAGKLRVTKVPNMFESIVKEFTSSCNEIDENNLDNYYCDYKFNLLQTAFVAISSAHYKDNWIQFYNDMNYLTHKIDKLDKIHELSHRFLLNHIALKKKTVFQCVNQQLEQLKENEDDIEWIAKIKEIVQFIKTSIFAELTQIKGHESEVALLDFLHFLYKDTIIDLIFRWNVISEKSSENLSHFISLIAAGTNQVPTIQNSPKYKELHESFVLVGKLLPLHLKEIMQMFYDGDFYLFTTEELVKWIVLLFADTPLRRDAIDDIYEIRGVSLND